MSALTAIAWIVVGYALVVTVAAFVGVALKAPRPRWLDQMAWLLELLSAVLALGVAVAWAQGRQPTSAATLGGYLAASVMILPVALQTVLEDRGSWSSGVLGVAALATGVVAVRIMMTR